MSGDMTTGGTPPLSPSREFGHARDGYAVEMNFAGFAFRSLTVGSEAEAQMIKAALETQDTATDVRVVRDR